MRWEDDMCAAGAKLSPDFSNGAGPVELLSSGQPMGDEFAAGQLVPGTPYRVVKQLGKGAMGAVHEVVDTTVDAPYVLKTLLPNLLQNRDAVALMRTEARVLANLQHENIVRVFTAGVTTGGVPYFVMDRLTGSTLQAYLRQRGASPKALTAIDLVVQMLRGLEYAHERGVIHRDIKPENIFLHLADLRAPSAGVIPRETRVKLLDFGILKLIEDGQAVQDAEAKRRFMGTPMWASPEQIACREVGLKSDLYSVGLILYYMLARRLPFRHQSMAEYISWARSLEDPPSIAQFVPDIHYALRDVIMNALEPDPELRPGDASVFIAQLLRARRLLEGNQDWNLTGATVDLAIGDVYDASGKTMAPAPDDEPHRMVSHAEVAHPRLGLPLTAPVAPARSEGTPRGGTLPTRSAQAPSSPSAEPISAQATLVSHAPVPASPPFAHPLDQRTVVDEPATHAMGPTVPRFSAVATPSNLSQDGLAQSFVPQATGQRRTPHYLKVAGLALGLALLVGTATLLVLVRFVRPIPEASDRRVSSAASFARVSEPSEPASTEPTATAQTDSPAVLPIPAPPNPTPSVLSSPPEGRPLTPPPSGSSGTPARVEEMRHDKMEPAAATRPRVSVADQARAVMLKDADAARRILEPRVFGSHPTREEVELLATICHDQKDQACVTRCGRALQTFRIKR